MKVQLTLTSYGQDNSLFDIYTNSNNYQFPFYTNVTIASLVTGFTINISDSTTIVKVVSIGNCSNSLLLPLY